MNKPSFFVSFVYEIGKSFGKYIYKKTLESEWFWHGNCFLYRHEEGIFDTILKSLHLERRDYSVQM